MNLIYYLTQMTNMEELARIGYKIGDEEWPEELPEKTKPFWWNGIKDLPILTESSIDQRRFAVWFLVTEYIKETVPLKIMEQERQKLIEQELKGKNKQT